MKINTPWYLMHRFKAMQRSPHETGKSLKLYLINNTPLQRHQFYDSRPSEQPFLPISKNLSCYPVTVCSGSNTGFKLRTLCEIIYQSPALLSEIFQLLTYVIQISLTLYLRSFLIWISCLARYFGPLCLVVFGMAASCQSSPEMLNI